MSKYNTRQKQMILSFLSENKDKCLTVQDILVYLLKREKNIGQTTIYRYLNELEIQEKIIKYQGESGSSNTYQFVCDNECKRHIHMKCSMCGNVIHLDCEELETIQRHIQAEHGFLMNISKTVIYGNCLDCQEGINL